MNHAQQVISLIHSLFESITLMPFDRSVFNSIGGNEHMFLREKEGTFHTVVDNGENVGIVGFIHGKEEPFLIVSIIKEFRGKGYLAKAYEALAKKYGFKKVYVDIEKTNKESIDSHKDFGFKELTASDEVDKKKFESDVRLSKDF